MAPISVPAISMVIPGDKACTRWHGELQELGDSSFRANTGLDSRYAVAESRSLGLGVRIIVSAV